MDFRILVNIGPTNYMDPQGEWIQKYIDVCCINMDFMYKLIKLNCKYVYIDSLSNDVSPDFMSVGFQINVTDDMVIQDETTDGELIFDGDTPVMTTQYKLFVKFIDNPTGIISSTVMKFINLNTD